MNEEPVPFGKYKGRPVADMLADAGYMAWLEGQPWFREKFAHMLRARDAEAASRTPEHNRLQALFLAPSYQAAFVRVCGAGAWLEKEARRTQDSSRHELRHTAEEARRWLPYEHANRAARLEQVGVMVEIAGADWGGFTLTTEAQFETGADVLISARLNGRVFVASARSEAASEVFREVAFAQLPIEIKPTVADEYPAVLRQMLRNKSRYLFVGAYKGEGATEQQFVQIFAASGIRVVFKCGVDVAAAEAEP
jgi:hypothetical protein